MLAQWLCPCQLGTVWARGGGEGVLQLYWTGGRDAGFAGVLAATIAPKHLKRAGGEALPGVNRTSADT